MLTNEPKTLISDALARVVSYRKSGLSLNHIVGCPLDCAYCVRHGDGEYGLKRPTALMDDDEAVARLVDSSYFVPHVTPLQLLNQSTDPLLPAVEPHTLAVLERLDALGLTNHVLVISRYRLRREVCERINALQKLRVTLFFTWSGIEDTRIEPVSSEIAIASLRLAHTHAERYRVVLYWRPIVSGLNDSLRHIARARELSQHAHATVFTGLFYREAIKQFFVENGLPELYDDVARRKILPRELEARVLKHFEPSEQRPLFRKTSCAVAYAHRVADYNGHIGVREICDICPSEQIARCLKEHRKPPTDEFARIARELGATAEPVFVEGRVVVAGLSDQHRYLLQHRYGYQVHDVLHPHLVRRHGRAEIGWDAP